MQISAALLAYVRGEQRDRYCSKHRTMQADSPRSCRLRQVRRPRRRCRSYQPTDPTSSSSVLLRNHHHRQGPIRLHWYAVPISLPPLTQLIPPSLRHRLLPPQRLSLPLTRLGRSFLRLSRRRRTSILLSRHRRTFRTYFHHGGYGRMWD